MTPELAALLNAGIAAAREACPGLGPSDEELLGYLAAKAEAAPGPGGAGPSLRFADLCLVFACLEGDARALGSFEERYGPILERTLARYPLSAQARADIRAEITELVFFGRAPAAPLAHDYTGRGDLAAWLRAIAVRIALKAKKRAERHVAGDEVLGALAAETNPEIGYLRRAHAGAFEAALGRSLATLTPRERNLLRQHYLDGLHLDALAQLYRVHRATAARWLADARQHVLEGVRTELAGAMSPSELESFLRATRPELGLQISTILRASPES